MRVWLINATGASRVVKSTARLVELVYSHSVNRDMQNCSLLLPVQGRGVEHISLGLMLLH